MEDLHATIAAHLRCQRRQVAEDRQRHDRILALWRERCDVPRCKVCGAAIDDDDGGLYSLAELRQFRECALHHTPF